MSLLFIALSIHHWVAAPPDARVVSCAGDLAVIGVGLAIHRRCLRCPLSLRGVQIATAVLALGVLDAILLTGAIGVNPLFTLDVAILMLASLGVALLPAWAIAIGGVELVGWAVLAWNRLPGDELVVHGTLVASSLAATLIVHLGRHRARVRAAPETARPGANALQRGPHRPGEPAAPAVHDRAPARPPLGERPWHTQPPGAIGRIPGDIAHDWTDLAARPAFAPRDDTVLVVEDDTAVCGVVVRYLERLGYRVAVARDGEAALQVARELDRVDALVTGVALPGIDGPELARRLRARWSELPVVFMAAHGADPLARPGVIEPRDPVIAKPYQLAALARILPELLQAGERPGAQAAYEFN